MCCFFDVVLGTFFIIFCGDGCFVGCFSLLNMWLSYSGFASGFVWT